jgi:DNA polymerase III delta prime subunit
MIHEYLDKNNLHHAYLIEGARDEIVPEIIKFLKDSGVNVVGNPDFVNINIDNFKIDEAFDLRAMSASKSLPAQAGFSSSKKIFLLCVNNISLDAQNVLLKMFEEPIENTHFFVVVPDVNSLLKTLVSRFYLISPKSDIGEETKIAEKFIAMPLKNRIDFIKELLAEEEDENIAADSSRSKALKFLNMLEDVLHKKMSKSLFDTSIFEHFFKVREFLRMPGSSTKTLMESVALITPSMLK